MADSQHSRGVSALRGGIGEQMSAGGLCCMLGRMFEVFEPAWETGDNDRAKLEGSQGCSNLVPA